MSTQVKVELEKRDNAIRREFGNVEKRSDARFDGVDAELKMIRKELYAGFGGVDAEFEMTRKEFDTRLRELAQFSMAQATNSRAALPRHPILPLAITDPSSPSELRFPPPTLYFPATVLHFWDLQEDRKVHKLVALCAFYGITPEEIVGDVTDLSALEDDEDPSPSSSGSSSEEALRVLQKTVMENRAGALSHLANRLHLNFESISYNMGPVLQFREKEAQRQERGVKRAGSSEKDFGRSGGLHHKRMVPDNTLDGGHSHAKLPSDNRGHDNGQARVTGDVTPYLVPLEELMFRESPESARTRLGYARDSEPTPERRKIQDISPHQKPATQLESVKSQPNLAQQSKDKTVKSMRISPSAQSTVPFSHTPTPIKEAEDRRRKRDGSPISIASQ